MHSFRLHVILTIMYIYERKEQNANGNGRKESGAFRRINRITAGIIACLNQTFIPCQPVVVDEIDVLAIDVTFVFACCTSERLLRNRKHDLSAKTHHCPFPVSYLA